MDNVDPTPESSQNTEKANKPAKRRKGRRRRLPNWLRPAEQDALAAACAQAVASARTAAKRTAATRDSLMVRCAMASGFRVSELCGLEVAQLDLAEGVATVLHGKGDKDRVVPLPARLIGELASWVGNRTSGPVFPGRRNAQMSERNFQKRIKSLARAAGIVRRIHPHVLRHTAATMLLKRGANLRQVQAILGHESIATTEIYLHVEVSELKQAVDRL